MKANSETYFGLCALFLVSPYSSLMFGSTLAKLIFPKETMYAQPSERNARAV
jgi:hypothetical protein